MGAQAAGSSSTSSATPMWQQMVDALRDELSHLNYGARFYTITELCRRFGVSTTTSIRVLNELSDAGLIEKIPCKGNVVRRMHVKATVYVLVPDGVSDLLTSEPANLRILPGLRIIAKQRGLEFHTLLERFLPNVAPQANISRGFLVLPGISKATRSHLRRNRMPHVLVNHLAKREHEPAAYPDWARSGSLATEHLLELGHRRIAFISGRVEHRWARARLRGYREALRQAGVPFRWSVIRQVSDPDTARQEVTAAVNELLDQPSPPTAIVAASDFCAIYIMDECRRRGLSIPGDISIIGYANHSESSLTQPPLTVVDACYESIAEASIHLLLETVMATSDGKRPADRVVPPELAIRGSTAVPIQRSTGLTSTSQA